MKGLLRGGVAGRSSLPAPTGTATAPVLPRLALHRHHAWQQQPGSSTACRSGGGDVELGQVTGDEARRFNRIAAALVARSLEDMPEGDEEEEDEGEDVVEEDGPYAVRSHALSHACAYAHMHARPTPYHAHACAHAHSHARVPHTLSPTRMRAHTHTHSHLHSHSGPTPRMPNPTCVYASRVCGVWDQRGQGGEAAGAQGPQARCPFHSRRGYALPACRHRPQVGWGEGWNGKNSPGLVLTSLLIYGRAAMV